MENGNTIVVELVYINPEQQTVLKLDVPFGSTIETVIKRSQILEQFPEINLSVNKVGVYNQLQPLDYKLKNKDRIEIYRPLKADPKEARRNRAREKS